MPFLLPNQQRQSTEGTLLTNDMEMACVTLLKRTLPSSP